MIRMTDSQAIACQQAGLSSTETARLCRVSQACVHLRAKKLKITYTNKQGKRPKRKWKTCQSCKDRKLCLLCHRLHVAALPCEIDLPYAGLHSETDPCLWPHYYLKLTCQVQHVMVE